MQKQQCETSCWTSALLSQWLWHNFKLRGYSKRQTRFLVFFNGSERTARGQIRIDAVGLEGLINEGSGQLYHSDSPV